MGTPLTRRTLLAALLAPTKHHQKVVLYGDIEFQILESAPGPRRYLRIHGNEETAREALESHIDTRPGTAFLVTNPGRYVTFSGLKLDPNRMFSRVGAETNLKAQNPTATNIPTALDRLDHVRAELLEALLPPKGALLFAVHNNGPGYSVNDEIPISQSTHIPKPDTPREFFLLTDPADFAQVARGPYNAVLQNAATGPDDGSLSRLCASRSIRYVNLECAHGNLEIQKKMMAWLEDTLPR